MKTLARFHRVGSEQLLIALGGNIKRARLDRMLTIIEVSELSTVSADLLFRLECGQARNLELLTLVKISNALKFQLYELLRFKPPPVARCQQLKEARIK
jgi:hypothetical protein